MEQVILPGNHEKVAKELQSAGVKRVVEMKPGSSLYDEKDFWQFKIHCYGTDEGCFLCNVCRRIKGIDWKTMDCLMSVRIFDKKPNAAVLKLIWKILCVVPDVGCIMILMCAKAITRTQEKDIQQVRCFLVIYHLKVFRSNKKGISQR